MLPQTSELLEALLCRFPSAKISVLADSCSADCCIDFLSANHVNADIILKIGEVCCAEESDTPFISIKPNVAGQEKFLADLRSLGNSHSDMMFNLVSEFQASPQMLAEFNSVRSLPFVECCSRNLDNQVVVTFDLSEWMTFCIALVHRNQTVYSWDGARFKKQDPSRLLSQRYQRFHGLLRYSCRFSALSKMTASSCVGILVHSTSCTSADLASRLSQFLHKKGHPAYVINMGRLNEAKLGNFPDIDIWVVVGCPRSIFNKVELGYRLLTPFELLCATEVYPKIMPYL